MILKSKSGIWSIRYKQINNKSKTRPGMVCKYFLLCMYRVRLFWMDFQHYLYILYAECQFFVVVKWSHFGNILWETGEEALLIYFEQSQSKTQPHGKTKILWINIVPFLWANWFERFDWYSKMASVLCVFLCIWNVFSAMKRPIWKILFEWCIYGESRLSADGIKSSIQTASDRKCI